MKCRLIAATFALIAQGTLASLAPAQTTSAQTTAAQTIPSAAVAACRGQDMIATLPADQRAALDAAVGAAPFPTGNAWRATKPGSTITIVGTMHLYDPRMDAMLNSLAPALDAADILFVEAGPREESALKAAVAARPELLMRRDGPTLPEQLTKPEWQALSAELAARGIPAFMASKFQPWYVTMLLGMPACAMPELAKGATGLDTMLVNRATDRNIPIQALEPFDTVFTVFQAMTGQEQIDMVRAGLATAGDADDQFATLLRAYFAGQHRLIWEYTRLQASHIPGQDPAKATADFALMEQALLTGRTVPWLQVILPAAAGKTTMIAVGAAHLSGEQGLLFLLQQAGYSLTEIPL